MNGNDIKSAVAEMENSAGISQGLLSGIFEHKTGWRSNQSALPSWRNTATDKAEEVALAAKRVQDKALEFDGIVPLAIDAFYRGDKATKKSLAEGYFPPKAVKNIYSTLGRAEKYGFTPVDEQSAQEMTQIFGQSPENLEKYRGQSATKSTQQTQPTGNFANAQLIKNADGTFSTNDPLLNTIMQIESRGNANAVSPTGAKGLFQFTSRTGSDYGLVNKAKGIDNRADPQANFEAMKRLTADNIKQLQKNGIPITPSSVYMAHQQGIGGTIEIYKAAQTGTEVPEEIRENMDVNGGKGLSPQQFIAQWENKVNSGLNKNGGSNFSSNDYAENFDVGEIPNQSTQLMQQGNELHSSTGPSISPSTESIQQTEMPEQRQAISLPKVDWTEMAKKVFSDETENVEVPEHIRSAIKGVLKGV